MQYCTMTVVKGRSIALQLLCIMDEWTTQLDSGGGGKLMSYTLILLKRLAGSLIAGY